MSNGIQTVNSVSQPSCPMEWDDTSTTRVRAGESSLADVARQRNIDPNALYAANPQIADPRGPLSCGQEIRLPMCEVPAEQSEIACFDPLSTLPQTSSSPGDPLVKSAVTARLHMPDMPKDECAVKAALGENGLRSYREVKAEFVSARQEFLKTGKLVPLKHFALIEIKTGTPMTRAERYNLNLLHQGKSTSYTRRDASVDPEYLSSKEYGDEWLARGMKEMEACETDNIRPGTKERCRVDVKERYMGKEYMEASWAATSAAWNEGAYIEKIKNSGPLGLGARVVGRAVGYAVDGNQGADKYEEILGTIGDIGDVGVAIKAGINARGNIRSYNGSAGFEVGRDVPIEIASKTGSGVGGEASKDAPASQGRAEAGQPASPPKTGSTGPDPVATGKKSVSREGSGTSIHNPKPVRNAPAEEPFNEGEELVIKSYMDAGKSRAEAEANVRDARRPENKITVARPGVGPNAEGSTRGPNWKNPGPGNKKP